jgi:hypothetical protein
LIDCNEEAMMHRLIYERQQPELATDDMFNRLRYLRNQASEYDAKVIDTGLMSKEQAIEIFEDYYKINLVVLGSIFQEI